MAMGVVMVRMVPFGEKGRPCGENHGFARWSDEAVETFRMLFEDEGVRPADICRRYGVPKSTLSYILNYKTRAVTPTCWKPKKEKTKDGVTSA